MCETSSQIISDYSSWRGSCEIEYLKKFFLEVKLLGSTVIGLQVFDMFCEGGDEIKEV